MDKAKYRRAFDSVSAPGDACVRVLDAVSRRPKGVRRNAAIVLCAVLILTCATALASGAAGQWLEAIISLNGRELPEANLQKINRICEGDGLRVTLDSVAGDGIHTYFLIDIEALDGQDLSNTDPETIPMEDSLFLDFLLEFPSSGGYGARTLRIDDGSDPARAQLVLKADFGVPRNGSRIYLTFQTLSRGYWRTGENGKEIYALEPVAEGEWTFSVLLDRNLDGVHYRIPEYDFDISISPLGLSINGVGCGRFGNSAYLLMNDGSTVDLIGRGYSSGKRNGVTYRELVSYEFGKVISPDRAVKLVADGNEFDLVPIR